MIEWILIIILSGIDIPIVIEGFLSEKDCIAAGQVMTDRSAYHNRYGVTVARCLPKRTTRNWKGQ